MITDENIDSQTSFLDNNTDHTDETTNNSWVYIINLILNKNFIFSFMFY